MKHKLLMSLLVLALVVGVRINAEPVAAPPVIHVVIFWVKNPNDVEAASSLIKTSKSFVGIPGLRSVKAGKMIPSERPVVDSTYQVGVVMEFENQAALDSYLKNPRHKEAVEKTLKPLVQRYVVYDFETN